MERTAIAAAASTTESTTGAQKMSAPSGLAALAGHWSGKWGGGSPSTLTVTADPESVEYCYREECWDVRNYSVDNNTLGWNNRGWKFSFTLKGDRIRGKLTNARGTTRITMKRDTGAAVESTVPVAESEAIPEPAPPAEFAARRVGDQTTYRTKRGEEITYEVIAVEEGAFSSRDSTGCTETTMSGYGPTLEWDHCEGKSGTRTVTRTNGALFPLDVGNEASWRFNGRLLGGGHWNDTRKCAVQGTGSVTVPAGTFETVHVECKERFAQWQYHYAPELGVDVLVERKPRGGASIVSAREELLKHTPRATP